MNSLLVIVLFFGIFKGFNAEPSGNIDFVCRDGEEYDMCRSPCEPTCDSIKRRLRPYCPRSCVPGCFCRDGYVRAKDNTCVPPEQCLRSQCPENEEYQECGSACPQNCTNLDEGIFCSKPCKRGCFCKPNFVRDANGKCVDPRNCNGGKHQKCPPNEHYVTCVNYCNTCTEIPYCSSSECTPGCDCNAGYFRNSYGYCVTAEECAYSQYGSQEQCGVNEIYVSCVNPCNDCVSRGRCDYDPYYCTAGCDCKHGYFRNERGVCVPERYCFPQCNENEIYLECGPACRSTCNNYKRLRYHSCKDECIPGCFCRGNFVLGPKGKCIAPENCPSTTTGLCPPGQTFYHCMPLCRTTCRSLSDSSAICPTECKAGCFCQPGLVLNDDGRCVRTSECPVSTTPLCPPGEAYYNCMPCPSSCDNLNSSCLQPCVSGCACERGLVRNRNGRCIRPGHCRVGSGIEGRRGGPGEDEDSKNSTLTTAPSTENTESVINTTQTGKSNATVLEPTERTTTDSNVTDAATTTKVADTTTSKVTDAATTTKVTDAATTTKVTDAATTTKVADTTTSKVTDSATTTSKTTDSATTTSKVTDSATTSKAPDTTSAAIVTDTTTTSKVKDTTTTKIEDAETTIKVENTETTSKVTGTKTTPEKSETSPSTKENTPTLTSQTSSESSAIGTSMTTNPAETSNEETTSRATVITTNTPRSTLPENTTSVKTTVEPATHLTF